MNLSVIVETEILDGKSNVFIKLPPTQPKLSFGEMSHILVSGISLLVKLSEKDDGKPDHELMKEIIEHLHSEFVSIESFSDAKAYPKQ